MSQSEKFTKHPLIDTLVNIRGNPRIAIYTEPLWIIPFNLYSPFVSVYMAALLLTDSQIGLVASVFMLFRAVSAFLSGAITDKLGRKLTTFIFDMASWSVPCLIWAFSQNFWWFAIAAAFNGLMQITDVSWSCLLIEDAEKSSLVRIFTLIHMISQIAVIFAPLSALLVNRLSVVPAMRILFIITFISMTIKFFILYKYGGETEVGKNRLNETKGMSLWQIMSGYGSIFKRIFASHDMILALVILTGFSIIGMVSGSFYGLYVTGILMVPTHFLAYFPLLRSVVVTTFLILFQPKLERFGFRYPMLIGLIIFTICTALLIFTPSQSFNISIFNMTLLIEPLYILCIYIILEAVAFSFVIPRSDSLTQILIEPAERARIRGLMMVVVLGLSIPFGYLAGWLSETDRRYPFVLIIILLISLFIVILFNKKRLDSIKQNVVPG